MAEEILQNPENTNINPQEEMQKLINNGVNVQAKPQKQKKYSETRK